MVAGKSSYTGLTGAVLAGGLSTRLGHDKARIKLVRGEEPDFLARAVNVLSSICDRVIVIGRKHPAHECYEDVMPGCGPVGGIATALDVSSTACLVLSCDLPFMEKHVLEKLLSHHKARSPGILSTSYRQQDTGHTEALVAIYEHAALSYFKQCSLEKKLKISLVIPPHLQHFVDYTAEEALPFFNINYPADLLVARKIMQMMGRQPG